MFNIAPVLVWRQLLCSSRDIGEGDWHEVPNINANIHGIARPTPVVVNVTEELQCASAGMVPSDHWVVAKRIELVVRPVSQLCEMGN